MPTALILIADGTEEMEFTITYDTLVRAGVECQSAFVSAQSGSGTGRDGSLVATGSRGIKIVADISYDGDTVGLPYLEKFDALVIPGGAKGAETISNNSNVQGLVRDFISRDKIVGMICAGSLTALTAKLPRQPLTSHPSVKSQLEQDFDYSEDSVVLSGKLVTSRGPGTTFPFAFALIELLCGTAKRDEVRGPMVFPADTPF